MISAIIAAAGKGLRMQSELPKQYIKIRGIPILSLTIKLFDHIDEVTEVIVTAPKGDIEFCKAEILSHANSKKEIKIVEGGEKRQDSIYNGLLAVSNKDSVTLIHDGVRPFTAVEDIKKCIKKAEEFGAAIIGTPVSDTLKKVNDYGIIEHTINRDKVWHAQTPQAFKYNIILAAHNYAKDKGFIDTDDALKVERIGVNVHIVSGGKSNIKITTKEDLRFAEAMIGYKIYE